MVLLLAAIFRRRDANVRLYKVSEGHAGPPGTTTLVQQPIRVADRGGAAPLDGARGYG
ncbi:hypothetical protein WME73_35825 [Sorangium sp. So ce302]|uniref:hypothetical protein n=1 Tax=Sorangium sp. So ce302 TaxID=3133297 RepID=UPI003F5EC0FE